MNFAWSEEQDAFRESVRRFVDERWPLAEVRKLADDPRGFSPDAWRQLAGELGLAGLAVEEAHGGQGAGALELSIVQETLGRELAGGPFFATACLAVPALQHGATPEAQAEWLPRLASGAYVAACALLDAPGAPDPDAVACRFDAGRLSGAKRFVLDAAHADVLLVAARASGSEGARGIGLYAIAPGSEGVAIEPAPGLDLTRRFAHVTFDGAPAQPLSGGASAWPALAKTLELATIALAAGQVGAAERCLERSVAHLRERIQFGRPLGSFQATKHRAVDVLTALELARSASWWASWVADRAEPGPAPASDALVEASTIAHTLACDAAELAAANFIHLNGGMGFTWEHDAHLYYRRARADRVLLGEPERHRAALARATGVASPP